MIDNNWGSAASSYHAGEIDFSQFESRTRRERERWIDGARRKLSPIPVWHAKEDSDQDFLLDLYLRGRTFDPARASAGGYFRHGIHNVGKRIQKARGVEQHRRTGAPRFEKTFTALGLDDAPEVESSSENAERSALRSEYYEILRALCETEEQLAAVCALQAGGGSLAGATARLYEDPDLRRRLRLPTRRRAASLIDRTVSELIAAYGKKEEEAQR